MALVTENYPKSEASYNQKIDVQTVPVGAEDKWVDAQDINDITGPLKAIQRAVRLQAIVAAIAPAAAGINGKAFRFDSIDATSGLGRASLDLAADLDKRFAAAIEKIEQGGDLDGTATAGGLFGVYAGVLTMASGAFATGTLLGLSAGGGIITYSAGKFGPIGKAIDATTIYVDLSVLRNPADGTSIRYNPSGELELVAGGRDFKESVRAATTAAGTLASDFENGDSIDGVALVTGNRILIKDQAAGAENGIYTVNASGAPTRADDYLVGSSAANTIIPVEEGTANKDIVFQCTNDVSSDVVGTDALVYDKAGGNFDALAPTTTKGDLIVRNSATNVREPVGTNGQVLTADSALASGVKWAAGGDGQALRFFADQLDNPNSADWTVNALAPAAADSNNAGLTVRLFDDTAEEGVGFILCVPTGKTNIKLSFKSRAETAPGAARTVGLKLYNRGIPDDAAVEAWSAGTALTDIDIPANEFFQYDSQTITLASLGLTAGEITQFELTRINPVGGTELVGDWALLQIVVEFT